MNSRFYKYIFVVMFFILTLFGNCFAANAETVGFVAELAPDFKLKNFALYKFCLFSGSKMKNGNFLVSTSDYVLNIEPMPSSKIVRAYISVNPVSASEFSDGTLLLVDSRKAARFTESGKTITTYNESKEGINFGLVLPGDKVMLSSNKKLTLKSIDNKLLYESDKAAIHLADTFGGAVLASTYSPHCFFEFNYDGKFLKPNSVYNAEIGTISKLKNGYYVMVSSDNKKIYLLDSSLKVVKEIAAHNIIRGADALRNGNFLIYGECEIEGNLLKIFDANPFVLEKKIDLKFLYE